MAAKTCLRLLSLAGLLLAAGCSSDGHFTLLGYTTRPPFDPSIRTVYVPIFGNDSFARGLEFEVTKAVIREIEAKTPYKVTSSCDSADTILEGKIVSRRKGPNNMNQLGEVRDVQVDLAVDVRWKDRRSGEMLSVPFGQRRPQPGQIPLPNAAPAPWVQITPSASYVPELGGTTASAYDAIAKQVARQIANMMEVWGDEDPR